MIFTCQTNTTWLGIGNPDQAALDEMHAYQNNAVAQGLTDGNVVKSWNGDQHSYLRNWTTVQAAEEYAAFQLDLGAQSADVIRL